MQKPTQAQGDPAIRMGDTNSKLKETPPCGGEEGDPATSAGILLVVAAALMNEKGEVLLAERPEGKQLAHHWEFPGGKVEAGEQPEAALIRELKEELGIEVSATDMQPLTFLSHPYPEFDFHLLMPTWLIRKWSGKAEALEHKNLHWCHPKDMHHMLMIEADRPLVDRLMEITQPSS